MADFVNTKNDAKATYKKATRWECTTVSNTSDNGITVGDIKRGTAKKLEANCQFFEKMDALFGERPNVMPSEHTSKRYTLDDSQGEYDSADDDVNSEYEDNSGDEDTVGLKQYWAACADDDPGKFNNSEPT
ncbi:hypothetical protein Ae201684P_016723 [Aphanomyces euteiches]|nr:hypothetical protein Ae201684P_016723 [Aphanomyces euteiches]